MPRNRKSRKIFPLEYGTFTRMKITSGPSSDECYVFALYFVAPDDLDEAERKILFTFNNCPMYAGEPPQEYAPNEFRRIYRQRLPFDRDCNPHRISEKVVKEALIEYHSGPRPVEYPVAKPNTRSSSGSVQKASRRSA